jgi:hypothetical protein
MYSKVYDFLLLDFFLQSGCYNMLNNMLQVYANYILTNFKILPVGLGGEAELGAAAAGDGGGESRCPRLSGRGRWWGRGCRAVGAVSPELHGRAVPLRGAGAQWGGRRRSCRGPGREGREARARGEGGAAGAQRRGRVRTGGVAAREDGGGLRRRRGDGGRAGGGAKKKDCRARERETAC